MATLAADKYRSMELGNRNAVPVIASEIIYEGAAVGVVTATGHARPLAAGDSFAGFAEAKADNSAGAAAALNVRVIASGDIELAVSGSVITDIGQPVYATDDDTFVYLPTGGVFIGFMKRHVSAGNAVVCFDALNYVDPYGGSVYETKSTNYTLDIQDNGKVIFVDTDAVVITLPVVATSVDCTVVNIASYGTALVSLSPATADMIHAPDLAGTNNKDHQNTKATAQRGDMVRVSSGAGDADGWIVTAQSGTWAQEA